MQDNTEYKKYTEAPVEALRRRIRLLNWIDLLVIYAILLLVVRILYEFLDYLGTSSFIAILSIIAGLVVLGVYLANTSSKKAITTIDKYSNKLNSLLTITKDIKEIVYGDVLLENILERSIDVIGADAGSILLVERDRIVFRIAIGNKRSNLSGLSIPKTQGITGWVIKNGTAVRVDNVKDDSRFDPAIDRITGYETKSILCAPLTLSSVTIGVLELVNKKDGVFSYEDEVLASYFADQAAIVISRTGFFEYQKNYARRFEDVFDDIGNYIEN